MTGSVFKRCGCRDAAGTQLGKNCPLLTSPRHGAWNFSVPAASGRGRLRRGGFNAKADAHAEMHRVIARAGGGAPASKRLTVADWLAYWLAEKTKTHGGSAAGKPIRETTARVYGQHIRDYLANLGDELVIDRWPGEAWRRSGVLEEPRA